MEMWSVQANLANIYFYEWATPIVPWVPEGSEAGPGSTNRQMLTTVTEAIELILMSMFMK